MDKEDIITALKELRKDTRERKFNQTVDLIINLKEFDLKRSSLNIVVEVPHKISEKKVMAFLEKKSSIVETVTKPEFDRFKDKKKLKRISKEYDFFIANAKLMPAVATVFGRVLGPAGKMPSPQFGVLVDESQANLEKMKKAVSKMIKIRAKEPSLKIGVGKQEMKDEEICENVLSVYEAVEKNLPRNKENIRNVLIKFTMNKPVRIKI